MQDKTLFDQWVVIYKRKWEILTVTLMAAITAGILSVVIDPIYEASLIFYPPVQPASASYLTEGAEKSISRETLVPRPNEDQLAPFIGLLKSKKVAERVAAEYPEKTVAKLLRSDMDFEVTNEYMLKLYARANTSQLAADVANAYFKHLNILLNEASMKGYRNDEEMLKQQLQNTEALLQEKSTELVEYERRQGIADLNEAISQAYNLMEQMSSDLELTQVSAHEVETRIKALQAEMDKEDQNIKTSTATISTPHLEHLRIKLGDLSEQLSVAALEFGPKHEKYLALKEQAASIENNIGQEVENLVNATIKADNSFAEKLRQDLVVALIEQESLNAKAIGYRSGIKRQKEKLRELPVIRNEWQSRLLAKDNLKAEVVQLQKDLREMELQKSREMEHLVLVDAAEPPNRVAFPILWLNLLIGTIVGLMGGLFYAYLLEYTKTSAFSSFRTLVREVVKNG